MVVAAEVLDMAVGAEAGQIAGAVHPSLGLGRKGIADKALGGEFGAVEVAPGDARAADVELAGHADGHWLLMRVQNVHLRVGDGAADGNVVGVDFVICLEQQSGGIDGCLGRAVCVQPAKIMSSRSLSPPGQKPPFCLLATHHDQSQRAVRWECVLPPKFVPTDARRPLGVQPRDTFVI